MIAPTENPAERECMNADELAKFLGVNRKTVYAYALRGVIPHRRLGRRIVFSRTQVVAWLGDVKRGQAVARQRTRLSNWQVTEA